MQFQQKYSPALLTLVLSLALAAAGSLVSTPVSVSAHGSAGSPQKSKDKKSKKEKKPTSAPTEAGTPIMWEDRGNIASLDLIHGIGNPESMPKAPFQFDKEDVTGTNPKIKVIDANGVKWNIKFDEEVHAEVAASRIAWACGYMVEESYFIASGKVNGVTGLSRAKKFVGADGSFSNGMFEKRPENIARRAINWDWDANPFKGTKELSGLAILNTMLNNWDAKPTNNNVLGMFDDGGKIWDWYLVADWGGSFGKMGGFTSHTKWDLDDYNKQAFLDGASGGQVKLHYSGKMGSSLKTIPLEHARWFAGIIGQLTDNQLRDAFKAAGATPAEIDGFSRRLRQKISELKSVAGR
ncbi:MAG: hypothetical protein U0X75_22755 [Acidobacteriota bacterium]